MIHKKKFDEFKISDSRPKMKRVHEPIDGDERRSKIHRTNEQSSAVHPPVFVTREDFHQQCTQYQELIMTLHTRILALEQERQYWRTITRPCGMEFQS